MYSQKARAMALVPSLLAAFALAAPDRVAAPQPTADSAWQSYRAHVAAAASALELGRGGEAQRWLAAAPAEHRGWEWRYLQSRAHQEVESLAVDEPVSSLALGAEGRLLAVGTRRSGAVHLWRRDADGLWRPFRVLRPFSPDAAVHSLAFDAAGTRLAGLASDGTVVVWSAAGDELRRFEEVGLGVGAVAWSPGVGADASRFLAAGTYRRRDDGSPYGVVQLWDAATGRPVGAAEHGYLVSSLAFSPSGDRLAAGTWSATLAVWTVSADGRLSASPRVMEQPPSEGFRAVQAVAWSPDGKRLAVADKEGRVRGWDPEAGEVVSEAGAPSHAHGSWANGLAFSPRGDWLASASSDGAVKLWRAESGVPADGPPQATLFGHAGPVWTLAAAADGSLLYTGSEDGTVKIWDVAAARPTVWHHASEIYGIAFAPPASAEVAEAGSDLAATVSGGGTLKLWRASTGEELAEIAAHTDEPEGDLAASAVAFSPDGRLLATGGNDGALRLWDTATGDLVTTLEDVDDGRGAAVSWSPDGQRVLSPSSYGTVKVWDVSAATGERLRLTLEGHGGRVYGAAFSPDGRLVATGGRDGLVILWDAVSGRRLATLRGHDDAVLGLAFHPAGRLLASASTDGTVRLWSLPAGEPVATLRGHGGLVWNVAFSPDGRRLASASADFTVRLWDTASWDPVLSLPFEVQVYAAVFSPDGRRLATLPMDGTARFLSAGP